MGMGGINPFRPDPSGEIFFRSEEKAGGPTDPLSGFEESVYALFKTKYSSYTQHPMFEYLQRFSHKVTPMPSNDEGEPQPGMGLRRNFVHIGRDLYQMPENKKNMLNCDQIFTLYVRECSAIVNETFYRKLITFILLFRECLNIYGWHKRSEHEVKEYYG